MSKNVADLHINEPDAMDDTILAFYGRRPPEFAVYRTDKRVMVHFADSRKRADEQRQATAKLNPLRGEINGLIDGWRCAADGSSRRSRAERYDRRVGDALVVAFEGDLATAERLLEGVKADILAERVARGRVEYLVAAFATGLLGLLLVAMFTSMQDYPESGLAMWRASAAGMVGAFFSISLAMRSRTVLPDLERTANIMDAVLRMTIGMMAGAVLMALFLGDVVDIRFGDRDVRADPQARWLFVLIIGFVAGFSERFVPDLLERASASTAARPATVATTPTTPERGTDQSSRATPNTQPAADVEASAAGTEEAEDLAPEEAAADGCVSEVDLPPEEATPDEELPAAAGGVETEEQQTEGRQ